MKRAYSVDRDDHFRMVPHQKRDFAQKFWRCRLARQLFHLDGSLVVPIVHEKEGNCNSAQRIHVRPKEDWNQVTKEQKSIGNHIANVICRKSTNRRRLFAIKQAIDPHEDFDHNRSFQQALQWKLSKTYFSSHQLQSQSWESPPQEPQWSLSWIRKWKWSFALLPL